MKKELQVALMALFNEKAGALSGDEICARLGASHFDVQAAVDALRSEGYAIYDCGGRLGCDTQGATAEALSLWLPRERLKSVACLDTVDSTNTRLMQLANAGAPCGQTVIANAQTGGKGRRGRSFHSPEGGIYLSYLLRPEAQPGDTVSVTAWTAVAVCRAIYAVCGVLPDIKWVNDIALHGRKLCGILAEGATGGSGRMEHMVIGIGLNVNERNEDIPGDIAAVAGSLRTETGRAYSRAQLAAELIVALDALRADWPHKKQEYLESYRALCVTVGREVNVISPAAMRSGKAIAVNDDFSLAVKYDDGTCADVNSGEVSVRGMFGYI